MDVSSISNLANLDWGDSMWEWLFGKKCEHDFQIIDNTFDTYVDDGIVRQWHRYVLYCPKCDRQKRVDAKKYDLEQKKQRLRQRYRR